eukprot:gene5675-21402_t
MSGARVIAALLARGEVQEVRVPRAGAQTLGIKFVHKDRLQVKSVDNEKGAAYACREELEAGCWVVACGGAPVRTAGELGAQLAKGGAVTLTIGAAALPADPDAWLRADARIGGADGGRRDEPAALDAPLGHAPLPILMGHGPPRPAHG